MRMFSLIGLTVCFLIGCAMAQQQPTPPAATTQPAAEAPAGNNDAAVDQTLDALDAVGDNLRDFTADVRMTETEEMMGDQITREGNVVFLKKGEDDAAIKVTFKTRQLNDAAPRPEQWDYALNDGVLVTRDYRRKSEATRHILKPGEKMNPLKLGEGPFPLPIGQDKDEVRRLFDVSLVEPAADDPENTDHLHLVPKPNTQFARKLDWMDVWVDRETSMPRRIRTADAGTGNTRTADLSNIRLNTGLTERDIELPPINDREWKRVDEQYQD